MNKTIARAATTTLLAAGIVAVPVTGSAFAAGMPRGGQLSYSHHVHASTSHVRYSESTQLTYGTGSAHDGNGYGSGDYGSGHGLLGLGLIAL
ncbi:hypothetical protein ABT263_38310 [Kitasatospora sp. NPDC001603]|uniref:hypothetical protein n=1 Tax=Kitasatospora sp. NPDC001603 TaxID=3154388 RepID=UPI00331E4B0A